MSDLVLNHPECPCDDFLRALANYESFLGTSVPVDVNPIPISDGRRVFKRDMIVGGRYNIYCGRNGNKPMEVEYLGESQDVHSSEINKSFKFRRVDDGQEEEWFFTDAGLEPYFKEDGSVWWSTTNWVGSLETDTRWIAKMLEKISRQPGGNEWVDDPEIQEKQT